MASKRVYWDACAWLALINEEPSRVDGCRYIIQEAEKGELRIVTSMLTLAEVYKAKCEGGNALLPLERDAEFERYLGAPHVDPVQVDRDIGTTARRLLRSYQGDGLKKPQDAIHLATAIINEVDELHTYDGSDLLKLNGKIRCRSGKSLKIMKPKAPDPTGPLFESPNDEEENAV